MSEEEPLLGDLERELTLLARHYMSAGRGGQTLDRSAYLLLTRLDTGEPLTLKQLAQTFHVDISTINRQVGSMLRQGLVERFPDPEGGAARKLRPTELGTRRLAADRRSGQEGTKRVIGDWPQERVEEFVALLTAFNKSIEGIEGAAWPRRSTRPS